MNNDRLEISITKDGFLVNTCDNKILLFSNSIQLIKYLTHVLTEKELNDLESSLFEVCKLKGMNLPEEL